MSGREYSEALNSEDHIGRWVGVGCAVVARRWVKSGAEGADVATRAHFSRGLLGELMMFMGTRGVFGEVIRCRWSLCLRRNAH